MWFSKLIKSFGYALEGLMYTLVTQRNMRIHFSIALLVLLFSLYLPIRKSEVLILFVSITLVLFAELINTAIEAVVDMVSPEYHPLAKVAKDVAAGAVLLTAGLSIIVGASIFYPYLNMLFTILVGNYTHPVGMGIAAIIVFNFFFTMFLKAWSHRMGKAELEPSMTTSSGFCIATLIVHVIPNLVVAFLVLLLLIMLISLRIRLNPKRMPIIIGACLGTIVSWIGMLLL
ncbi:diacylglycerol kinase family protein [Hazenella sp. IB182357]|uniref:Diacylglycerol kinase family protein n=1 Tax=Polycladospora coralii TaxID=2771432 RepID=A0A926NCP8_9BACL|nr:diacylglycerol kinase family protein [Polycladospora coralii]MBD1371169.1 diacylglycerol kinase family protein [Polycladospora coralii]MBS7530111.1 diacylglycerol kinase family protein [Polycladospora coralii]